jgi:Fe2+ or Zn2+ uptake regulation protein
MSPSEIAIRVKRFEAECRRRRLPLTPQKRAVFEAVASTDRHPTAQELHVAIRRRLPDLSFATVYKNLALLSSLGLVREFRIGGGVSRFDANTGVHAHVYSLGSDTLRDADVRGPLPLPKGVKAGSVDSILLVYYVH